MRSMWIRTTAAVAAIVLAGAMTACGSDDETSGDSAGKTVKVGGIFDLSGATADVGTPYADGIKGYMKYHNKEGDGPQDRAHVRGLQVQRRGRRARCTRA